MADAKPKSIEEILAACRRMDGQGAPGGAASSPTSGAADAAPEPQEPAAESAAATPAPVSASESGGAPAAAKKAPADKGAAGMSVADILAAARAEKAGGAKPAAAKAAPAKAAPDKAAPGKASPAKPAPAKSAPAKAGGPAKAPAAAGAKVPLDTSSILAAARAGHKPGPMSKAEAVARGAAPAKAAPAKSPVVVPPMPAKPAYVRTPAADGQAVSRRGVFGIFFGSFLAVGFTTLGLTNLLWTLGAARFFFPNVLIEPPNRFKVGFPADFSPGVVDERFKTEFGVWVVNTIYEGQPMIVALRTVCTHLGCTPNWLEAEQKFKCPCHGSGFYKEGINFEGPAPRPLERYAIRLADDGQLEVDKSRIFQQEMGQWSDPLSFVPV